MKPPPGAIFFKLKEGDVGDVDLNSWVLLSKDDRYLPLLLHKPTGLVFGLSGDEDHAIDVLPNFAVCHGQHFDEFGNMRKMGSIAREKLGRCAIKAFLVAIGMWDEIETAKTIDTKKLMEERKGEDV